MSRLRFRRFVRPQKVRREAAAVVPDADLEHVLLRKHGRDGEFTVFYTGKAVQNGILCQRLQEHFGTMHERSASGTASVYEKLSDRRMR